MRCLSKECRRKTVLDFAKRAEMSVVNTLSMKMRAKHKNRVINEGQLRCKQTFTSVYEMRQTGDCKVVLAQSVAGG